MKGFFKTAALAAFALALGFGISTSQAAPVTGVNGGSTSPSIDGWYVSPQVGIALSDLSVQTVNGLTTLVIENKTANFPNSLSMAIGFFSSPTLTALDDSAIQQVEIQGEQVFNGSSQTWTDFSFNVNTTGGGPALITQSFSTAVVNGVTYTFPSVGAPTDSVTENLSQAPDTVANWGLAAGSSQYLLISLNGATGFTFDEVPSTVIPLPAAAWQGLVGLLGLGGIALGRKIKKQLA